MREAPLPQPEFAHKRWWAAIPTPKSFRTRKAACAALLKFRQEKRMPLQRLLGRRHRRPRMGQRVPFLPTPRTPREKNTSKDSMNTPNKMPPHLSSITPHFLYLEPLIEEADDVMNAFMDRGYDPDIACTLTDLTLARYDEKGAK